jgi:Fe-S cluster assembly protein SufD
MSVIYEELPNTTLTRTIVCAQNSSVTYTFVVLEGSPTLTLNLRLEGPGASVQVNGIYALAHDQRFTMHSTQWHGAPSTTSQVRINGCVADQAQADYQGMITITPDAPATNASQYTTTLLVGPQARATAIPSLEVLTNDVRCAHGSAIGQLDAQHLLYLQSRGLPYAQAIKLLLEGFFADLLENVPDVQVRERLISKLYTRAHGYFSHSS